MHAHQSTLQSVVLAACLASCLVQSSPIATTRRPSGGAAVLAEPEGLKQREVTDRTAPVIVEVPNEQGRLVARSASDAGQRTGDSDKRWEAGEDLATRGARGVAEFETAKGDETKKKTRRSLSEIFSYASNALVNGPNIELGILGIIVDTQNNGNTAGFDPP